MDILTVSEKPVCSLQIQIIMIKNLIDAGVCAPDPVVFLTDKMDGQDPVRLKQQQSLAG